jgi:hypothetical protein
MQYREWQKALVCDTYFLFSILLFAMNLGKLEL